MMITVLVNAFSKDPGERTLDIDPDTISHPRWLSGTIRGGYPHALQISVPGEGSVVVVGSLNHLIYLERHCYMNADVASFNSMNGEHHEPA